MVYNDNTKFQEVETMKKISLVLVSVLLIVSSLLCISCVKTDDDTAVLNDYEERPFIEFLKEACRLSKAEAEEDGSKVSYSVGIKDGWEASENLNADYLTGAQKPVTYSLDIKMTQGTFSRDVSYRFFMILNTETNVLDVAGALFSSGGYDDEYDYEDALSLIVGIIEEIYDRY